MAAESKSSMDPVFEAQLRRLRDRFRAVAEAALDGTAAPWAAPDPRGWGGDLTDVEGLAKAFDRSQANSDAARALSDPSSPGTDGDLVVASVQAHYLGCLERAYRMRHLRGVRAAAHSAARAQALGDDSGPLVRCALGHVRDLLARSKQAQQS